MPPSVSFKPAFLTLMIGIGALLPGFDTHASPPSASSTAGLSSQEWRQVQAQLADKFGSAGITATTSIGSRGSSYAQQAFLKASNADTEDHFGVEVAINEAGTILVVGARYEDSDGSGPEDNSLQDAGAVYVFERQTNGDWIETAYLKPSLPYLPGPSGTISGHQFGLAVGISGETIVVGEPFRDIGGTQAGFDFNEGAVYVFDRDGNGNWVETEVLLPSRPDPSQDQFGSEVAISGDRLLIAAERETQPGIGRNGAVRAYTRNSEGVWQEEDVLLPLNSPVQDMLFGRSIALDDDRAIIGAPAENSDGSSPGDESALAAGAAFIFERDASGQWHEIAYLKASNADSDDFFGFAVGLSGPFAAVGAYGEDSDGSDPENNMVSEAGAVYIFEPNGSGEWVQTRYLKTPAPSMTASLGWSLDLKSGSLLVGANREENRRGASYLYQRDNQNNWVFQQRLIPDIRGIDERFGHFVAQGGGRIVSSAWWEMSDPMLGPEDDSLIRSGAVYIFERDGFAVGGSVTGLLGQDLVLQLNSTDDLELDINGQFTLPGRLINGAGYSVSVAQQPIEPPQFCSISNGSGTISNADVADVEVVCSDTASSEGLLEPAAIAFGSVLVGQSSVAEPLVFGNIGSVDLGVFEVMLTGSAADQYVLVLDECLKTVLGPGQSCDLSVQFQPTSTGLKLARLEVASDDPASPAIAELNGIGIDQDNLFSDSFE